MEKTDYSWWDIIKIPFRYAPSYSASIAIEKILSGLVPTLQVIVTAKFLDTAIAVVSGDMNYSEIFLPLISVVLLIVYSWVSEELVKLINVKLEMKLREKFRVTITEKRAKLKYKHVENKDTWDLISRVSKEPEIQCKNAYNNFLELIALFIRVIGLLVVLVVYVWWAALIISGILFSLFMVSLRSGEDMYEANREVSKYRRRFEYLGEVLTGRESVEERTLFGYTDEINKKWEEQYETARKIEYNTDKMVYKRTMGRSIFTIFVSMIIIIILIRPVYRGLLSTGIFISISTGVIELTQLMSWQFTFYVTQFSKDKEYLKDLDIFMKLNETKGALDLPSTENVKFNSLEFRNVSFKYPGTDNYILRNISFIIRKGLHYAFVGVNGAGKTTITKLVTGLYDEFEGDILINGKNIKEYSQSELKSLCSVVYQDFAKYFISLKDNIAIGNINSMNQKGSENDIKDSMKIMGLEEAAEKLPKGWDTPLGKIKSGGLDLSGGQWQRIGMARAIVGNAPIKILDEPTAALDPISESHIYEEFEQISRGGTTIFISHRLGSTKLADEIFVIDHGSVAESGSHNELMKLDGIYANMYESQRSWYL